MALLINLLINSLAVGITAYLLQGGVTIESFSTTIVVAIVLGVLNTFIKPILSLLALPITVITLGIFSFIINGLIILLASNIVPGFRVDGFLWAVLFSIVLSVVSSVLGMFTK
ncbi:MAG: phage holin family protein [Weeksellaceae bacterium]